jgi:hypothetical protein
VVEDGGRLLRPITPIAVVVVAVAVRAIEQIRRELNPVDFDDERVGEGDDLVLDLVVPTLRKRCGKRRALAQSGRVAR